jgi:hypothetical protein
MHVLRVGMAFDDWLTPGRILRAGLHSHRLAIQLESRLAGAVRMHEVHHSQPSVSTAHRRLLLLRAKEGVVALSRHAAVEKQLGGGIRRDSRCRLRKDSRADRSRHLPAERPQKKADRIPSQIADPSGGFEPRIDPDV